MSTINLPESALGEQARSPAATEAMRIYVAAPKSQHHTARYQQLATSLRVRFPNAAILQGLTLFRNAAHWRAAWPAVLASTTAVVFVTDPEGWIGRGVWFEIQEARRRGPVSLLTDGGQLVPLAQVTCSAPDPENWTSHVRVSVGLEA